jgi:glycosyltransferase involved in cell wall biosynthesis
MKFSICIPNYNYAGYIERTIRSALDQSHSDLEVLVCDNASTDDSVAVVRRIADPRLKLKINACNVGYAGNLDKVVQMATADRITVVSSDDLLRPEMLARFDALYERLGAQGERAVIGARNDLIDPDDRITGSLPPSARLWRESDRAPELDELLGGPVYRVSGRELLRRCLETMSNPYNLTSTVYPRALYQRIEGYGGGRLMNPDKWFHWRLLGVTETAYYVDRSFGASRWHPSNQTAQQTKSGALKYLVDEYVSTFQIDNQLLEQAGLTRTEFEKRFVEYDIARHGLATLACGDRTKAKRMVKFADAVYPQHALRNEKLWALRALLAAGPLGGAVSKVAYQAIKDRVRA